VFNGGTDGKGSKVYRRKRNKEFKKKMKGRLRERAVSTADLGG